MDEHLAGIEPVGVPATRFTCRGHEFEVGLFPSPHGSGYEILITDSGGVLLVTGLDVWLSEDALKRLTAKTRDMLVNARDAIHRYVTGLDEPTFKQLLATPRHRAAFRWSSEVLEAVRRVDWSAPDAKFEHHGHEFSIGHCAIPGGVLVLLRDRNGIFDGSASLGAADIAAEALQGGDMIARGVAGMREMVKALKAPDVRRMVAKPRVSMAPEALH